MRDCASIGKPPIGNEAECRDAALLLGLSSYVIKGSWWHYPKGCVLKNSSAHNYVFWNNVQTGRERNDWFVICQKSGMCGNSYCNVVYKVKGYNISFVM